MHAYKETNRRLSLAYALLLSLSVLIIASCGDPLTWNADVRSFVEDGLTVVSVTGYSAQTLGVPKTIIPSVDETVVTINLLNPRSVSIDAEVHWTDDSLFNALPVLTVAGPTQLSVRFSPSPLAEWQDLDFSIDLAAPELNRTYAPYELSIHCNTPPADVSGLVCTSGPGSLTLTWADPPDADLDEIRIQYSGPTTGTVTADPGDQTAVISGLASMQMFTLLVTAFDGEALSSTGESASGAPDNFTVSGAGWTVFIALTPPTAVVTGYTGNNLSANIPADVGGFPVTEIRPGAFYDGSGNIIGVTIPNTVTEIGDSAFAYCWAIGSLVIPDSVVTIGAYAFQNLSACTVFTIPDSVMSIGNYAFYQCFSVTTINVYCPVPPALGSGAFEDCTVLTAIYVPAGTLAAYQAAPGWSTYSALLQEGGW